MDEGKNYGMTAEIDIYRAANILVKEYGAEQAPLMAAKRADAMLELAGRATGNSVMNGFADDPNIAPFVDDIYAYLRGRADGVIGRGRPPQADEP
jgi:hypothetical protein